MSRLCSLAKKYNSTSSRCPPLCTFCLSCGFLLHAYYTAAGPCNETKNELSYFESKRLPQMQKGGFMGPFHGRAERPFITRPTPDDGHWMALRVVLLLVIPISARPPPKHIDINQAMRVRRARQWQYVLDLRHDLAVRRGGGASGVVVPR